MSPPRLLSLATAVPRHRLDQGDVAAIARRIFDGPDSEIEYMLPIFENAGIEQRYSCVPLDWYLEPVGWQERNRLYLDNALDLIETAARDCLERAGLGAGDVDALLCVSTTGLSTPSLDARLMDRLPFRPDVERLPVFGLGCAGGTLGLARAAALAKARPGSRVLLLVVELCGLTFRPGDQSRANIVATALFGDGAAAALVTAEPNRTTSETGPCLVDWGEHRWPNSQDVMGWQVEADGFGVLFSKDIPSLIRADFVPALDRFPRRREGRERRRRGARPGAGVSRPRPRGAARLRQHVGGLSALRARTGAGRTAPGAPPDNLPGARLHGGLRADGPAMSLALEGSIGMPQAIVLLVAAQRLAELVYARRNARRLLAEGGVEHGAGRYPLLVLLHAAWLVALFVLVPPGAAVSWPLLALYLLLQAARLWVLASLGRFWTTRVITLPQAPLVARGPYRWLRHPNYLVVAAEIAVLPLAFGAWQLALGFSLANALVLADRIRTEERALAPRRGNAQPTP
jgi:alkylresorcinol/alkylpyrone synthase